MTATQTCETDRATTEYISIAEAERETRIHRRTIQRAIQRGELRAIRPGARWLRVRRDDLQRWLDERVVIPTAARKEVCA